MPEYPRIPREKYLDIGLSDIFACGTGFFTPGFVIYHVANRPDPSFTIVWLAMLVASFIVFKRSRPRIIQTIAKSLDKLHRHAHDRHAHVYDCCWTYPARYAAAMLLDAKCC